jgi:hypothetical protein
MKSDPDTGHRPHPFAGQTGHVCAICGRHESYALHVDPQRRDEEVRAMGELTGYTFEDFMDDLRGILAKHDRARAEAGHYEKQLGKLGPVDVRPVCECGAGPERLSTWHEEAKGWDCRHCGGFVPRAHVTGEKDPNAEHRPQAIDHGRVEG